MEKAKTFELDDILEELGPIGKFQIRNLILIMISIAFDSMRNVQYVFNAGKIPFRCKVPECEEDPPKLTAGDWKDFALPSSTKDAECYRFKPVGTNCAADAFSKEKEPCSSWVYEEIESSIVGAFDIPCQEWKRALVGSVHNFGLLFALLFVGALSDRFGRKWTFITTSSVPSIVGLIRAFSTTYVMYLIFEFLDAALSSAVYSTGFILALEMVGPRHRNLAGCLLCAIFAIGQASVAFFAWLMPYWRLMTMVLYVPVAFFVFYYSLLNESVRWLMTKRKHKKAIQTILKAARINKATLSKETLRKLEILEPEEIENMSVKSWLAGPLVVLRSSILRLRLLLSCFWFTTATFIYYGLSIHSVALAGNKYINFSLVSLAEIPGCFLCLVTLDRFGRKRPIMISYFICGISLFSLIFLKEGTYMIIFISIAKVFITLVFSALYVYVLELAPTEGRHTLMGCSLMVSRIGSIAAPQIPLLLTIHPALIYILFSVLSFVAGFLLFFSPETRNLRLADTAAQAEHLGDSVTNDTSAKEPDLNPNHNPDYKSNLKSDQKMEQYPDKPGPSEAQRPRKKY